MNKISFVIPTQDNITSTNLSNVLTELEKENGYTEITTNVYKFNDVYSLNNTESTQDIMYVYMNARESRANKKFVEAIKLFTFCENNITNIFDINIKYEIYVNLALLNIEINSSFEIISSFFNKSIEVCPDRAEPYYYFALYCNQNKQFDTSYQLLHKALLLSYDNANIKYTNVQKNAYGKFLYDELSVACYWINKFKEGLGYIEEIIDDPVFNDKYSRLNDNLHMCKNKLNNL